MTYSSECKVVVGKMIRAGRTSLHLGWLGCLAAVIAAGCDGPKPADPAIGREPAARLEAASAALTSENFEKIRQGATAAEVDQLLGKGRDAPSPPAFYKKAAAAEIESEFGVQRWREWWTSASGMTITVGFGADGKALVKQLDDGAQVRFVGWKDGQEIKRTAG